jgi:molybdate transport system substrate-binding protein
MTRITLVAISSAILLAASLYGLSRSEPRAIDHKPLVLFCAASNRAVIEDARVEYERDYGVAVQVQYGASQTLLSSIEVSGAGDLYLPADDSYLDIAEARSLLRNRYPIARMKVVLVVRKGNPQAIGSLKDLTRNDVRLVQGAPDAAAIGKIVRDAMLASGDWAAVEQATVAFRTTVTEVANDVALGAADAGFIYDVMLSQYPGLEVIALPELARVSTRVSIATLASTSQPEAAARFANFLISSGAGHKHYAKHGFDVSHDE